MKSIKWTGAKGNEIELRAECKITMVNEVIDADGWKIERSNKVQRTDANLELYVDGKMMDSCWNTGFWTIVDAGNGIKKVAGLRVGMTAAQAELVKKFLTDVIESGKTEEAKAAEEAEAAADKAKAIKAAKKTIAEAEAQQSIPTAAEYRAWRKRWNDINNEGGEGYIPTMVTKEQYDAAKKVLANQ